MEHIWEDASEPVVSRDSGIRADGSIPARTWVRWPTPLGPQMRGR